MLTPAFAATTAWSPSLDVAHQPRLTRQRHVPTQSCTTRNPRLRAQDAVRADRDVVRDLHEVVDLRALADVRAAETRAVHGRVRADFHVVVDLHDAGLRDFDVATVFGVQSRSRRRR